MHDRAVVRNEDKIANDYTRGALSSNEVLHIARSASRWTWCNIERFLRASGDERLSHGVGDSVAMTALIVRLSFWPAVIKFPTVWVIVGLLLVPNAVVMSHKIFAAPLVVASHPRSSRTDCRSKKEGNVKAENLWRAPSCLYARCCVYGRSKESVAVS
ncbi:hypothetical protein P8T80_00860 [Corynebacterium rouxii]|uniref:Uncharacterized protein n=1 Tax=Corynebacterium rouxii TaxID=2719119 RepID=A0ABU3PJQ4_9CORY|nr:hypothetical protein [Corynebacterium rouxii]